MDPSVGSLLTRSILGVSVFGLPILKIQDLSKMQCRNGETLNVLMGSAIGLLPRR